MRDLAIIIALGFAATGPRAYHRHRLRLAAQRTLYIRHAPLSTIRLHPLVVRPFDFEVDA